MRTFVIDLLKINAKHLYHVKISRIRPIGISRNIQISNILKINFVYSTTRWTPAYSVTMLCTRFGTGVSR